METNSICPSCGRENGSADARFCMYCGAAIAPAKSGEGIAAIISAITAEYKAYNEWTYSYHKNTGAGKRLAGLFTGNNGYKTAPEHMQFFESVKKHTEELLSPELSSDLTQDELWEMLCFALLTCHDDCEQDADWMFLAAEKNFEPFLELLDPGRAAELLEKYKLCRKKDPGFQVQSEILKKLKKKSA